MIVIPYRPYTRDSTHLSLSLSDIQTTDLAFRQIIIISVKGNEDNFNQLSSEQFSPLIMFGRIIILNLIDILCEIHQERDF